MKNYLIIGLITGVVGLTGYSYQIIGKTPVLSDRWYNSAQVQRGRSLYQANCASCHKSDMSGTPDWRKADAQGKYPPPPLNGTAHTWHHSLATLRRTIMTGGVPLGGTMPGFADQLNQEQIDDILSWIQSHWSDEIYRRWEERNSLSN